MKKFLCALLLVAAFAAMSSAEGHRLGVIERLNMSPADFMNLVSGMKYNVVFTGTNERPQFVFYRSMAQMILALNAGEIDEMMLPEASAEYLLNANPEYVIRCIIVTDKKNAFLLSFGFSAEKQELAESFNKAIAEMKRDGTLITLQGKYIMGANTAMIEERLITDPNTSTPNPVVFRKFEDAPEIRAAVTGDLPPIDYIAPDGSAQGFNAAILAEICGRLGLNVKLQNIDSGARAAMLLSGRSDVVFWFEHIRGGNSKYDVPDGIILSEPYYEFNTLYHIGK